MATDKVKGELVAFAVIMGILVAVLVWRVTARRGYSPVPQGSGPVGGRGGPVAARPAPDTAVVAWESHRRMDPMAWPRDPFSGVGLMEILNPRKAGAGRPKYRRRPAPRRKAREIRMLPAPEGITLNGILSDGSSKAVIINGEVLREGDSIPETGLVVESIDPSGGRVILSGEGKKYLLE